MAKPDFVFVGIKGSVVAIDRATGSRVWETKLKGVGFVTVVVDGGQVLAGTQGELFCLNATTGKMVWHDGLKGYGFGLLSIATQNGMSDLAVLSAEQKRQQESSSAATAAS